MRKFRYTVIFILALFLPGCAGIYNTVSFEVLEPATVKFPDYIENVVIMNRSPVSFDLFDEEDVSSLTKEQLIIVDTIITHNILKGVNKVLRQSPVALFKFPVWIGARRNDTTGLDIPMSKREVNDVCIKYGCDAIISMEYYNINIDEIYDYFEGELSSMYFEVSSEVRWAIYLFNYPRPFNEYTTKDTLYFPEVVDGEYVDLPSSADMIRSLSFESGLSYGQYLVPTWFNVSRVVYKGREDILKETSEYTDAGNWDKAYETWKTLLNNEDSTLAAKAAFNIAVYHELEDDLGTALLYVQQSVSLDSTDLADTYLEDLQTRILNKKQVIEQLE